VSRGERRARSLFSTILDNPDLRCEDLIDVFSARQEGRVSLYDRGQAARALVWLVERDEVEWTGDGWRQSQASLDRYLARRSERAELLDQLGDT